jgi:hypothetical protein
MSLQMFSNNMSFWILKYRKELTTFSDFKIRSKFKLTKTWNEELFNKMLVDGEHDNLDDIKEWVIKSLKNDNLDESYYINATSDTE